MNKFNIISILVTISLLNGSCRDEFTLCTQSKEVKFNASFWLKPTVIKHIIESKLSNIVFVLVIISQLELNFLFHYWLFENNEWQLCRQFHKFDQNNY